MFKILYAQRRQQEMQPIISNKNSTTNKNLAKIPKKRK